MLFFFLHFIKKYKANVILASLLAQVYHRRQSAVRWPKVNAGSLTPETFIFLLCMYVLLLSLNVSYGSADHQWCLFIMDLHNCNEWTCMGIKVTKIICNVFVNVSIFCFKVSLTSITAVPDISVFYIS